MSADKCMHAVYQPMTSQSRPESPQRVQNETASARSHKKSSLKSRRYIQACVKLTLEGIVTFVHIYRPEVTSGPMIFAGLPEPTNTREVPDCSHDKHAFKGSRHPQAPTNNKNTPESYQDNPIGRQSEHQHSSTSTSQSNRCRPRSVKYTRRATTKKNAPLGP